jgi:CPA2 family monovalent cation:H+ antiporter-2
VLRAAGVERAKAVVATFDHRQALDRLLSRARQANADLALIVSATDDRQLSEIAKAGATIVFPENIAAGLTLADQILVICGFSQEQAAHIVTTVRATIHPELAGFVGR